MICAAEGSLKINEAWDNYWKMSQLLLDVGT